MNYNFPKEMDMKYFAVATVTAPGKELEYDAYKEVLRREEDAEVRHRIMGVKLNNDDRTIEPLTQTKRNPNYHYIHGKAYDLRPFFQKHPGGADILKMTQGLVDATPTFESYHAFANRPLILKQLEQYRVHDEIEEKQNEDSGMYSFDENGFYRTLTKRVRAHFGAVGEDADKKSLTKETKANAFWAMKVFVQCIISAIFYYFGFFYFVCETIELENEEKICSDTWSNTFKSIACAVVAANFFIQWGFTAMHDASHFAIAPKNHWINQFITKFWCALSLWVAKIWMLHHAVLHHAYTGVETLDPDIHHAMPFVRKHPDVARSKVARIFRWLGDSFGMFGWAIAATTLYVFAPGMWLGQVLQYFAFSYGVLHWKYLWGMTYPKGDAYETKLWETGLIICQVASHLYRANPFVTYAFILSLNFSYAMCIVADHDTAEAAITNHVDVDMLPINKASSTADNEPESEPIEKNITSSIQGNYGKVDWGETQVRNSSNFNNHWAGDIFAFLHGGINYQTEHHLFPGMNHIHLPAISPIVRQTCEEFNIPYTAYPSLRSAWYSFLIVLKTCMTIKEIPNPSSSNNTGDHDKTE